MNQVTVTASDARKDIYQIVREVASGLREYVISLKNRQDVVMVAKDEYDALKETAEILSLADSKKMINQGLKEIEDGEVVKLEDL